MTNDMNTWFNLADEANLFTGRERKNIKEAITTLDPTPLTRYAIEDLCDAIYKLGQFANTHVIKPAPEELLDKTKKWLDTQTAEERLSTIKDICVDWDGYRTAAGLGGLVNEIWAYAAYPCKNEALQDKGYQTPSQCPFCGGNSALQSAIDKVFWVKCEECGASTQPESTPAAAIKKWNYRA